MTRSWHQRFKRAPKADRTSVQGDVFDSKAELAHWAELQLRERAGEIRDLRRQVPYALRIGGVPVLIRSKGYPNGRVAVYTLDFQYTDSATGALVRIEWKGHDTAESRLRRAVVEAIYGFEIIVMGPAAIGTPRMASAERALPAPTRRDRIGRRSS